MILMANIQVGRAYNKSCYATQNNNPCIWLITVSVMADALKRENVLAWASDREIKAVRAERSA